jgi:hypothetical protein
MNPLLLAALLSGGSTIFGAMTNKDPYAQLMDSLKKFTDPNRITADTTQMFNNWRASPAFSGAQTMNMGASNMLANQMRARLGGAGIASGGVGQAAQGLANSSYGPLMSQLFSQGWQNSSDMAQKLAQLRVQGLGNIGQPQNIGGQFLGGGIAGMGDIIKYLMDQQKKGG